MTDRQGVAALVAVLVALAPVAALAQGDPGPTTTTETSTTTTTGEPGGPGSSTTTSRPDGAGPSTTSTVPPVPDDPGAGEEEAPPAEDPPTDVSVPEPDDAEGGPDDVDPRVRFTVHRQLESARAALAAVGEELGRSVHELAAADAVMQRLSHRLARLRRQERALAQQAQAVRATIVERATRAYVHGPTDWQFLLEAGTANDALHRAALLQSVLDDDRGSLDLLVERLDAVRDERDATVAETAELAERRRPLRQAVEAFESETARHRDVVEMFEAGSLIGVSGFVFPVAAPFTFGDSWGAPRMTGTEFEHWHRGTDIFAPAGTELLAVERGVVARVGADVLGGTKLWLVGESGTRYYYAHLTGYAPGIEEGAVVAAGSVVGYVGDSGNARGGTPHLHFEVHPPGIDGPVNPYPILAVTAPAFDRDQTGPAVE